MSAQQNSRELIQTINAYFSAISMPFREHGAEILKFIGDAILVLFAVHDGRDEHAACRDAVAAAQAANAILDELNLVRAKAGLAPLEHGIGLHFGEAEYGNVGTSERLDFTVIGLDVNAASRIEGLCGTLGQRLLLSGEVAQRLEGVPLRPVGTHALKGISAPVDVFSLAESPPAT